MRRGRFLRYLPMLGHVLPTLVIGFELVGKRAFDVPWPRVVAFDEVAVVAVHRPHAGSDLRSHVGMKLRRQPMRPGRQVDGQVFEAASMCPASRRQHRLHARDGLAVVSGGGLCHHGNCRMHCRITG